MADTSEVYKYIYHYTTWEGLLGILESQNLWATHYKSLNDFTETVLFKEKLITYLKPYVRETYSEILKDSTVRKIITKDGGLNKVIHRDTTAIVEAKYYATGEEIYITSFCGENVDPYVNENGLLSQWRGYGGDGGFAIKFDTKKLEKLLKAEEFYGHVSDVIYSNDIKFDEFRSGLECIAEYVKNTFINMLADLGPADATDAYPAFIQCITRYKHRGFSEEDEVRIVSYLPIDTPGDRERKYRDKKGIKIPYVEIFKGASPLPIEGIIVGPHKQKAERAAQLRKMVKNSIKVTVSDIPYVG